MKQVMTLRSFESLEYLCSSLGLLADMKLKNENLYGAVSSVFG